MNYFQKAARWDWGSLCEIYSKVVNIEMFIKRSLFLIMKMDYDQFFKRKPEQVAVDLLGRTLIKTTSGESLACRILETGAYEGDRGTTSREGMLYTPSALFLMPYRGTRLLNIATGQIGEPSCVEIRKVLLGTKTIKGSGKIATVLGMTPDLDGILIGEIRELQILGNPVERSEIRQIRGQAGNCLGYFSMKE